MADAVAPSPTLTVDEAAALLGIGRNMAYDAAKSGQLPVIKIGRRILVIRHKLEEMIGSTRKVDATRSAAIIEAAAPTPPLPPSVDLPSPVSVVRADEPRTPRADDDGLLNLNYILANAAKFKRVSAVYFLTSRDEIIYVGQALDVYARISSHIYEGTKRFTSVFMLHCEPADLDSLERKYIKKFRPRYNVVHNIISEAAGLGAGVEQQ